MLGRTFSYRLVGLAWEFLPLPPAYRLPKRSGVRERDRPTNPPDHMRIWRGVIAGVAAVTPRVTTAAGLPFGVAVWLGAHVITVPALGLAEPPTRQPPSKEGLEFVLHLIYGAVTELMRRLAHLVL